VSATAERVVVVGAGHAAAQLCASLVASSWTDHLTMIGDEPILPYHRPPLSKARLQCVTSDGEPTEQLIRPETFYREHGVRHLAGVKVTAIDRAARQLILSGEPRILDYDTLVLATGSLHLRPPLPGIDHERVHTLRTAAEAASVRRRLSGARSVAVIGAGFIGLEASASLRQAGLEVTVLERGERPLARVTSPVVSEFFTGLHRGHGVELRFGAGVTAIHDRPDGVRVELADSAPLDADLVVLGAGGIANDALARAAGLAVSDPPSGGVLVDACQRTDDPHVLAIGDCCNRANELYGGQRMRLESVQNANDQAKVAAATIAGLPRPAAAMPWFWSDQYDVKLQIAGLSAGYDRCVLRGRPEPGSAFSVWYFRDRRLLAVDAVNDPRAYALAGKLIPRRLSPDPALVADTAVAPRDLLRSAEENAA